MPSRLQNPLAASCIRSTSSQGRGYVCSSTPHAAKIWLQNIDKQFGGNHHPSQKICHNPNLILQSEMEILTPIIDQWFPFLLIEHDHCTFDELPEHQISSRGPPCPWTHPISQRRRGNTISKCRETIIRLVNQNQRRGKPKGRRRNRQTTVSLHPKNTKLSCGCELERLTCGSYASQKMAYMTIFLEAIIS